MTYSFLRLAPFVAVFFGVGANLSAQTVVTERCRSEDYTFPTIPAPALNDAGSKAKLLLLGGELDANGAKLEALVDGKWPSGADEPKSNVFFGAGQDGGRVLMDLGEAQEITALASFSWHPAARAAQRYKAYAAKGDGQGFDVAAAGKFSSEELMANGWKSLGEVNTSSQRRGQHAARISAQEGETLGSFRYLLLVISANDDPQGFGNTFYSEIDIETKGAQLQRHQPPPKQLTTFESEDKSFRIVLDSTASPDLLPWFKETSVPVLLKWYPKVSELICLPGKTPEAPKTFEILLKEGQLMPGRNGIPAYANGNRMTVSSQFMRAQLKGEALGCLIHEMVHVVQFGSGKRADRSAPSWLLEGATDYIRWFLYEPESKGAVIRNPDRVHFNDSYRTTANFIDWVTKKYTKDLLQKIHIALHQGYSNDDWKTWTGKTSEELETEWKADLKK